MVQNFEPEFNKVYFINKYTFLFIQSGVGLVEVDFQNYSDYHQKAIFLSKGQYIKFLSDDFKIVKIEFDDGLVYHSKEFRVLFKHLIALGYIDLNNCMQCQDLIETKNKHQEENNLLKLSTHQWYTQNPFQASKAEYQKIFDVKDLIDSAYVSPSSRELNALKEEPEVGELVKNKIGVSITNLLAKKRTLESQRAVVFTDHSMQEIAYNNGFKDPGYFNRAFKRRVGQTPLEFRKKFNFSVKDSFAEDIVQLVKQFHKEEHQLSFYADKMHMSIKSLSRKTKAKLNQSVAKLIRVELMASAKEMLIAEQPIQEVAYTLGFKETQHFTSFFKKNAGQTPSGFIQS